MGRYINNNTTSINSLKRIGWIDNLRGFCMLAILLDHTESYYLDYHIINQNLYLTDALVFFFILSGYLMYKPQQQFCIAHKMKSIGRSLLMPYFIFYITSSTSKSNCSWSEYRYFEYISIHYHGESFLVCCSTYSS